MGEKPQSELKRRAHALDVTMGSASAHRIVRAVALVVIDHEKELTDLDLAIGDGDHGLNMRRGFLAVLEDLDAHTDISPGLLLDWVGTTLVMKVGGASGPLYGTLFMALGRELPSHPTRTDMVRAFGIALGAVKARGRAEIGQKTMLDVLYPSYEAFAVGRDPEASAHAAALATIPMVAQRGRASFLGARSAGHMDPGARSSALIIAAAVAAASQENSDDR